MDGDRIRINNHEQTNNVNTVPPVEQLQQAQINNQFGAVRDRLFHAMLVRVALSYSRHFSLFCRRLIEFGVLFIALSLLWLLFCVHMFGKNDSSCLSHLKDSWPRDGVLRIEVISNLENFNEYQNEHYAKYRQSSGNNTNKTYFNLKTILVEGPKALPKELKIQEHMQREEKSGNTFRLVENMLSALFFRSNRDFKKRIPSEESTNDDYTIYREDFFSENPSESTFHYVVEYSLHYGLLRLSHAYRTEHNIPFMLVRLDPEVDQCFGSWFSRMLMKYFIGYEDVLMASVKMLAENETEKGYLRDMITGDHYRFVTMAGGSASFLTAFIVMLIFTFAVSMLLRFSHHQIFLFIVDVLQMFELNHTLIFPAAPLLTVILALVGMEAIMSEIFNDTSTAFYVILLVWIADQYDAICCSSPISKRFWLRFFYMYHYAFYAYHYRYNGQYSGLALLTSSFFILHSMIFFLHHYEMPLLLYMERTQRTNDSNVENNESSRTLRVPEGTQQDIQDDADLVYLETVGEIPETRMELNLISLPPGTDIYGISSSSSNFVDMPSTSSLSQEQGQIPSTNGFLETNGYLETNGTGISHSRENFNNESETENLNNHVLIAVDHAAQEIVDVALNEAYRS